MKPTLLSLRHQTKITTQDIAQEAGVSISEAYVVEIGGFADREVAEKVIRAFSRLSGTEYTLDDIRLQNVSTHLRKRASLSDLETTKHAIPRQEK